MKFIKNEDRAPFARKIVEYRAKMNYTQAEFAANMGIPVASLGYLEARKNGESNAIHQTYYVLLKKHGCDLEGLVRVHSRSKMPRINHDVTNVVRASKVIEAAQRAIELAKKTVNDLNEYYAKLDTSAMTIMAEMENIKKAKDTLLKVINEGLR